MSEALEPRLLVRVINLARRPDRRERMEMTLPEIPGVEVVRARASLLC